MIVIIAIIVIGGTITMVNAYREKNFVELNREKIEERVRHYVKRYKLDPDKLDIVEIGDPFTLPRGEKFFSIYIKYYGHPYLSMALNGDPETLAIKEHQEYIAVKIFNELYLEERYDEFKPVIDYLEGLGIIDPLRPENTKVKYFQTSVGLDTEISSDLKDALRDSDESFDKLRKYIKDNKDKISRLDTEMDIVGRKEGIDDQQASEIKKQLITMLPKSNYHVQLGVRDPNNGVAKEGLFTYLEIE